MRALEPAREQHAEALMGEPSLERIADEIVLLPAREGLDQDLVGPGTTETSLWMRSQSETWSGSRGQWLRVGEEPAHAVGEIGRERELAAVIGRHLGLGAPASG